MENIKIKVADFELIVSSKREENEEKSKKTVKTLFVMKRYFTYSYWGLAQNCVGIFIGYK